MSVRRTAPELVRSASRFGLRFKSFSLVSEGTWTDEDADWNYKDVPHLNQVHSQADTVPATIGDDFIATINFQKIAGIPVPIALANYVASDGTQVYYTTLACFVLIVETAIGDSTQSGSIRSRVETTYHIGGPSGAIWLYPILRRILTANYKVLMSEDLPMRAQRGRLRLAGYSFASDGRPRTFAETTDLTVKNVIPPTPTSSHPVTVDLRRLEPEGTVIVGDSTAGFRLIRTADKEVAVFDRVCDHEGACLDSAAATRNSLVCPWHAKRVKPLGTIELGVPGVQQLNLRPGCDLVAEGDVLTFTGMI